MTNEQAHHYFFSAIETGKQIDVKEQEGHDIYLIAEKALEKQIPKKPSVTINPTDIKIGSLTWKTGAKVHYCPICNNPISCDKYCRICGQKLDWRVEE